MKHYPLATKREAIRMYQAEGRTPPKRENTEAYIARLEMEVDLLKKFHAELRKLEFAKRNIGSSTTKEKNTT